MRPTHRRPHSAPPRQQMIMQKTVTGGRPPHKTRVIDNNLRRYHDILQHHRLLAEVEHRVDDEDMSTC